MSADAIVAASTFATAPAWARARQPGVASSNGESNRSRPAQHGSPAQSRRVWLTSSLGLSGSSHSTPMTPMLAVHKPCPSHIRLCCTLPLAGSRIPNASLTLTPLVRSPPAPQREYYSELSSRSLQIPSLPSPPFCSRTDRHGLQAQPKTYPLPPKEPKSGCP